MASDNLSSFNFQNLDFQVMADDKAAVDAQKPKVFLFVPSEGKNMKSEYPELATIEEFQILTNAEMIFVWLLANETSPYSPKYYSDRNSAVALCLKLSKLDASINQNEYAEYINRRFPAKIVSALKRMRKFDASARMRAKIMSDKMFANLEMLINLSEDELKNMPLAERKTYAQIVKDVTSQLQDLVTNYENNFGIKEVSKKVNGTVAGGPTLMDKVLSAS